MEAVTRSLVLDLVEWLAAGPRPYAEVMDAWRTSCPRLTVWEDAVDAGLVAKETDDAGIVRVRATAAGIDTLLAEGRAGAACANEGEIHAMFAP